MMGRVGGCGFSVMGGDDAARARAANFSSPARHMSRAEHEREVGARSALFADRRGTCPCVIAFDASSDPPSRDNVKVQGVLNFSLYFDRGVENQKLAPYQCRQIAIRSSVSSRRSCARRRVSCRSHYKLRKDGEPAMSTHLIFQKTRSGM